jgi:signal-transduction protein with cAMP-binding, CBS, and nucleotidyltransferase domain
MASQLHEDVRHRLAERLTVRVLRPGAELVAAGQPVSGMLLVGYGSVSLDLEGAQPIRSGEFVFPEATMSAGRATVSASAGERGAVMLVADRRTTQELYATEPLLLELLAASC